MAHPQYSVEWIRRRREAAAIQGAHGAWFCGAYFGNGFHEDGARSAQEVVDGIAARAGAGGGAGS